MARECNECSMCCYLPGIQELVKPAVTWCEFCTKTHGCSIYDKRPEVCRQYECMWKWNANFPDELKPSKSKVMFSPAASQDAIQVYVHPRYPEAVEKPLVMTIIERFREQGIHVIIITGKERKFLNGKGATLPPEVVNAIAEEKPWMIK